jgi:hypothetical protein
LSRICEGLLMAYSKIFGRALRLSKAVDIYGIPCYGGDGEGCVCVCCSPCRTKARIIIPERCSWI